MKKENKEINLTKEELKTLTEQIIKKSYLEGIQYAIDVLIDLKKDIINLKYEKDR